MDRFFKAPKGIHPLDVLLTCKSAIVLACRFVSGTLAVLNEMKRQIGGEILCRLSVILTELELEADPLSESLCIGCNLCVDACPVKALESAQQNACWDYAFGERKKDWRISCHKCRDICPFLFVTENKRFRRKNLSNEAIKKQ